MSRKVAIFDTTLRDGEQSPGVSLTQREKLEIARQLARLGVDVIEAGFPVASPGEKEAVQMIAEDVGRRDGPVIAALSRAVEKDIRIAGEALQPAKRRRIHTFIATSEIHLHYKLRMTREQVLDAAVKAVRLARNFTEEVEFSAEDATRSDPEFLCQVFEAAIDAGATTINIPDTVGYTMPQEFGALVRTVFQKVPNIQKVSFVSVHCHNDLGLAVANSLAGLMEGANQVECTINGIGERAGNASLEEIVMAIYCRGSVLGLHTTIRHDQIVRTSHMVREFTGMVVQPNKAIVGANAFRHESGIHQHGVLSNPLTYEIIDPKVIGLSGSGLVLGKHSGRHALEQKLREMGYELTREQLDSVFQSFKALADRKKEVTDADLETLVADVLSSVPVDETIYHLDYMHVVSGKGTVPSATVRIRSNGQEKLASETGVGPIDAVYRTIARIVAEGHRLADFQVRSVGPGTDAVADVVVRIEDDEGRTFVGHGVSPDTIEAATKAYLEAINRLAYHKRKRLLPPQRGEEV